MNKSLVALVGLLAVCGFMTGCSKKKCETSGEMRRDKKAKKMAKKSARKDNKRYNY